MLASEPDLRLGAAWDPDPGAVPGVVSSYAVREPDRAISRADAVVICAPTDQRPELAVRAARAGRPVLMESPVARTAAEGYAAAREIERSRTPAAAALFLRQVPALGRLRAVLRARVLGRICGVSASYVDPTGLAPASSGPTAWLEDPRRVGLGGFGQLAVHLLDALAALGSPVVLEAVGLDRAPGRPDLGGAAVGRWIDVPLTVRASRAARPAGLELAVTGTAGSAVLRDGTLELIDEDGGRERWVGAPPDPGEALRGFAARLRTRRLGRDGLTGALRAQETVERAMQVS